MKKELVWILGCVGLTLALVERTIGLSSTHIGEVQLHNTYLVFPPFSILIPAVAMMLASVYLARCILNGFSQVAANLILIGSTVIICLIGTAGIIVIDQSAQGGWVIYPSLNATPEDRISNPFATFLNGYEHLLIYMVVWWGIIAVTTTAKTLLIMSRR